MAKVVVGKTLDVQEGKLVHITAGGKEIVVTKLDGNYYAMDNICTHAGAELHEGELNNSELICPWHGAKWDIKTGSLISFPQKLKPLQSYKVLIENDTLYVEMYTGNKPG
ncbi:MAG TPA: Rieske 2Fe-2S domain-containing protein [Nitrososphaeraceae archaeon]|nr:Rieske 2Fe-2S domain-containing protein [Nitrososphaeraceae archaeon]